MPTYLQTAKDPDDIDDVTWDWSARLASGETISTFTATVVSGDVAVSSTAISGTNTTARLTGGTAGSRAEVRGRMVTSTGRQLDWTIGLPVAAQ